MKVAVTKADGKGNESFESNGTIAANGKGSVRVTGSQGEWEPLKRHRVSVINNGKTVTETFLTPAS
ncbi:hypothetical protein GCM10027418_08090 [Mariniluteicoccus endophyticus]